VVDRLDVLEAGGARLADHDLPTHAVTAAIRGDAIDVGEHPRRLEVDDEKPPARLQRVDDAGEDRTRSGQVMVDAAHHDRVAASALEPGRGVARDDHHEVAHAPRLELGALVRFDLAREHATVRADVRRESCGQLAVARSEIRDGRAGSQLELGRHPRQLGRAQSGASGV
jgi:hypothetical protein